MARILRLAALILRASEASVSNDEGGKDKVGL